MRGLEGAADTDTDQVVTLRELSRDVEREPIRHGRTVGVDRPFAPRGERAGRPPLVRTGR